MSVRSVDPYERWRLLIRPPLDQPQEPIQLDAKTASILRFRGQDQLLRKSALTRVHQSLAEWFKETLIRVLSFHLEPAPLLPQPGPTQDDHALRVIASRGEIPEAVDPRGDKRTPLPEGFPDLTQAQFPLEIADELPSFITLLGECPQRGSDGPKRGDDPDRDDRCPGSDEHLHRRRHVLNEDPDQVDGGTPADELCERKPPSTGRLVQLRRRNDTVVPSRPRPRILGFGPLNPPPKQRPEADVSPEGGHDEPERRLPERGDGASHGISVTTTVASEAPSAGFHTSPAACIRRVRRSDLYRQNETTRHATRRGSRSPRRHGRRTRILAGQTAASAQPSLSRHPRQKYPTSRVLPLLVAATTVLSERVRQSPGAALPRCCPMPLIPLNHAACLPTIGVEISVRGLYLGGQSKWPGGVGAPPARHGRS